MSNFGYALEQLKNGYKVARSGWNGSNQYIFYVEGGTYEHPNFVGEALSYLAIRTVQNAAVPWLASQTDLLADDWYTVY